MFSPHRGDVLHGLPDSYSVRRACHLPPLSLEQNWWHSSGLAIHLSLSPRSWRQLAPFSSEKFDSRIGRNEPLLAEVNWSSSARSKVYIRLGVGTGTEQKCDVCHMSNTTPQLSCGTPCPLCLGDCAVSHLVAGPPAWCEHSSGTEGCLHQVDEGTRVAGTSFSATVAYRHVVSSSSLEVASGVGWRKRDDRKISSCLGYPTKTPQVKCKHTRQIIHAIMHIGRCSLFRHNWSFKQKLRI